MTPLNTPLNTPAQFRNNSGGRANQDPYGINPLPNIVSPYQVYHEPYPNLESWGISNQPFSYNEPFTLYRNQQTPRNNNLPSYYRTLSRKTQKPYIVVPNTRQSYHTSSSPIFDENERFNYILSRPYNPRDYSPPLLSKHQLETEEYLRNAHQLLNSRPAIDPKHSKELFSTKFIEDLEYRPQQQRTRPNTQYAAQPYQPLKYEEPELSKRSVVHFEKPLEPYEASEYIKNIKREADYLVPKPKYVPDTSKIYNSYAVDIAENLYRREVDMLVREMAEQTMDKEENFRNSIQEPVYDDVYESTLNSMSKDVAREILAEHDKQIQHLQNHEIKKVAKEQIVNNIMLDTMLDKMAAHGKVVAENDDVTKLLDSMTLDVLLKTNSEVGKVKDKTLRNYPLKKFHLNSFMNVALDILVAELSSSLEEDIKELDDLEIKHIKR